MKDNNPMKRFLLLVLAVALLLCSCGAIGYERYYTFEESSQTEYENGFSDPDPVLAVNGHPVTYSELRYYARSVAQREDPTSLSEEEASTWLTETVIPELLFGRAVAALAEQYEVNLTKEEIDAVGDYIAQMQEENGEIHTAQLSAAGLTDSLYEFIFTQDQLGIALNEFYTNEESSPVKASDETVFATATDGTLIRVKHILILDDAEDTPEENRATAENLLAQLKAGADFDTLMEEYSEDPGLASEPDGSYFYRYEMPEAFEAAAMALSEGEISQVIRVQSDSYDGWHIIRKEAPELTYVEENLDTLRKNYMASAFYGDIYEMVGALTVTYEASLQTIRYLDLIS